jgi:hypothetical protein
MGAWGSPGPHLSARVDARGQKLWRRRSKLTNIARLSHLRRHFGTLAQSSPYRDVIPLHVDDIELVRPGMTREDVRKALGDPDKTFRRTSEWIASSTLVTSRTGTPASTARAL